jgi:hypothetical protein
MPHRPHRPKYADLHHLSEDERIELIGRQVVEKNAICGVLVDDKPGIAGRYILKLKELFPQLKVIDVFSGPTRGVVTIKVGPRDDARN